MSASALAAAQRSEFVFGIHFESNGSLSSSQLTNLVEVVLQIALKGTGYTWRIERFSSDDELADAFLHNKIDAAHLFPDQIVLLLDRHGRIRPLASYTVAGKRKRAFCLWQAKSNAVSEPSQIIGKTFMSDYWTQMNLIQIRDLLYSLGVDKPLWNVFSSFTKVPGQNSSYMAVAMGKADFLFDSTDFDTFIKLLNPNVAGKMTRRFCSEPDFARGTIVLNERTMPRKSIDDFTKALKAFEQNYDAITKSDPRFQSLRSFAKLAKMNFIPTDPDEFKTEAELYRNARKKGWIKEADYIIGVMKDAAPGKPVVIRPTYTMCRAECAKATNLSQCVGRCMNGR